MPIYEYRCNDCGAEFEVSQGMDDEPLTICKQCAGSVHRLISFTSFSLKGGGWYSDGYANGNGSAPKKESSTVCDKKGKSKDSCSSCSTTTIGKD
ncbi:MAG: zinc ribbon domain-containing protein [Deltaproteobacteria bacterium]|nr:zinc ribbon domain-containing protein [Deltaproteobacteria bacterium]